MAASDARLKTALEAISTLPLAESSLASALRNLDGGLFAAVASIESGMLAWNTKLIADSNSFAALAGPAASGLSFDTTKIAATALAWQRTMQEMAKSPFMTALKTIRIDVSGFSKLAINAQQSLKAFMESNHTAIDLAMRDALKFQSSIALQLESAYQAEPAFLKTLREISENAEAMSTIKVWSEAKPEFLSEAFQRLAAAGALEVSDEIASDRELNTPVAIALSDSPQDYSPAAQEAQLTPARWLATQPMHVQLFVIFLVFLLSHAAGTFLDETTKQLMGSDKAPAPTVTYNDNRRFSRPQDRNPLRRLRANLRIRSAPSREGMEIVVLPAGAIVEALEVRRDWTRVRSKDPSSGEPREGWAASSYLAKTSIDAP
jgi:hypothetical protein